MEFLEFFATVVLDDVDAVQGAEILEQGDGDVLGSALAHLGGDDHAERDVGRIDGGVAAGEDGVARSGLHVDGNLAQEGFPGVAPRPGHGAERAAAGELGAHRLAGAQERDDVGVVVAHRVDDADHALGGDHAHAGLHAFLPAAVEDQVVVLPVHGIADDFRAQVRVFRLDDLHHRVKFGRRGGIARQLLP